MNVPIEAYVDVTGGRLRYRWLCAGSGPVLVFENGWAASHEQWAWIERELAGEASLLFYSHAGIGGSTIEGAQTVAGLSAQFAQLLDHLGLSQPVVVVGHSFGGLLSALHAAQQPGRVAAIVQLDNTQEVDDAELDKPLRMVKGLSAFAGVCARLGIRDPVFGALTRTLPADAGARMHQLAFASASSMRTALAELALLVPIRAAIAGARPGQPRRVISAGRFEQPRGVLARMLLLSTQQMEQRVRRVQQLHRNQAWAAGSTWTTLPHTHSDLVFTREGAADVARDLRQFVYGLQPTIRTQDAGALST
jgi:pimeloyl-ACP methyl ester carboxylesterase